MLIGEYQDIPRLYTAIAEFFAAFLFCMILPKRLSRLKFILLSIVTMTALSLWLILTGDVDLRLWIPCMLLAVLMMFLYLRCSLSVNSVVSLYTTMKAFLIAEFVASLEWQIEYFYQLTEKTTPFGILILLLTYSLTFLVIFRLETKMTIREVELVISEKELILASLIVVLSFAVSNLNFVYRNSPFSSHFVTDIFITRTLVDLVGLAILYAYQIQIYELSTERELLSIHAMLKTQYEHYRNYQEHIDLINYKYHDLKHQLAGLRAERSPEKREQWIDQMEEELDSYKPETQTGNQVLDGILDAKMAMIRNNRIKFTCVADGDQLSFLHVTDICTIFGNALDNAIESVVTVEDPEKRMIHMSVSTKKQFLYITVENYCDHSVQFAYGKPVTTKKDSASHGFGTKSIAYTAEKYGGNASYHLKNDFFCVNILIPIPERHS